MLRKKVFLYVSFVKSVQFVCAIILLIVNRVKQGETIAHLSKKYHINKIQILVMARMWDTYDRFSIRNGRIVVPH